MASSSSRLVPPAATTLLLILLLWNTLGRVTTTVTATSHQPSSLALTSPSRGGGSHVQTLHVIVLLEEQGKQPLLKILQKAINEVNADYGAGGSARGGGSGSGGGSKGRVVGGWASGGGFQLVAIPLLVDDYHSPGTVRDLCKALDQGNVSAIVSVGGQGPTLAAVTVGGYAGIPVLGIAPGYSDQTFKDLNRYFQPLNPTLDNLASALSTFLLGNSWLSSTFLSDDSLTSVTLRDKLVAASRALHPHALVTPLTLSQSAGPAAIFDLLSDVVKLRSRVLVVHGPTPLLQRVFEQAKRLNMDDGDWIWILTGEAASAAVPEDDLRDFPVGVLGLRVRPPTVNKHVLRMSVRILGRALSRVWADWQRRPEAEAHKKSSAAAPSCWYSPTPLLQQQSRQFYREIQKISSEVINGSYVDTRENDRAEVSLRATVDLLNLVTEVDLENGSGAHKRWRPLGNVTGGRVSMEAVIWPGNKVTGPDPLTSGLWRVATVFSPPFVMTSEALANHTCLVGVACLKVSTDKKEELSAISADFEAKRHEGAAYNVTCCYGYAVDLLTNMVKELRIEYVLYLVADGHFGMRKLDGWDGIMGDLVSGAAQLAFAPISVTAARSRYVDFSVPYYFSGISLLTSTKFREVPLLAFLAPFSAELWTAIATSLLVTAVVAAIYEWLSPFGLNPWGRQRTKNFSLGSALWVTWSLLFSHLVAFKAPKSWPNKVLINVWGCFSVIFLASYTANIAALFAGLFFQTTVNDFHDRSLLTQRVGTTVGTVAEYYISINNRELYEHMKKYNIPTNEEGVRKLRDDELDLIVGDTPLLDYYRGQEPGCTLRSVGPLIKEDSYAIATNKGSPLRDSISSLIAKYHENGYLDYLTARWYHGLPCIRTTSELYRPMRLSIDAVAGVFITLCIGMLIGFVILVLEHLVYKYILPDLRSKPKGTLWRSPNIMFFSQKLYRFINCVDLVSPHHSAKELVNNLRTGQITSLFQKSIKRKEHEQRRRRKSKAQFFEMIQEIRRVQKEGKGSFLSRLGAGSTSSHEHGGVVSVSGGVGGGRGAGDSLLMVRRRSPVILTFKNETGFPNPPSQFGSYRDHEPPPPPLPLSLSALPYYTDESCVQLIERVGQRSPSPSSSCSSEDGADFALSAFSASLNELSTLDQHDETALSGHGGRRTRKKKCRSKVRSVENLKQPSASSASSSAKERHVHFSQPSPSAVVRGRHHHHHHHHQLPLTKFDFFDLPLKLNDPRMSKLSKGDIVFMWQTSERDLRRRLQQALKDKNELEKRVRELEQEPP